MTTSRDLVGAFFRVDKAIEIRKKFDATFGVDMTKCADTREFVKTLNEWIKDGKCRHGKVFLSEGVAGDGWLVYQLDETGDKTVVKYTKHSI